MNKQYVCVCTLHKLRFHCAHVRFVYISSHVNRSQSISLFSALPYIMDSAHTHEEEEEEHWAILDRVQDVYYAIFLGFEDYNAAMPVAILTTMRSVNGSGDWTSCTEVMLPAEAWRRLMEHLPRYLS